MAKRQNDSFSLKDLMGEFLQENNLSKGMKKIFVQEKWAEIMGPGIVSYTSKVELKGKLLLVSLTSSVLREELSFGKEKIIQMMNEALGGDEVEKIILK